MKKHLSDILHGVDYTADGIRGQVTIQGVTADSRKVATGTLFVCVKGLTTDGHRFAASAAAQGAAAIMANRDWRDHLLGLDLGLPLVWVEDTRKAMGEVAAAFYAYPARGLVLVGLTGTNGKTTTSFILERMIQTGGGKPGVIGTINYRYGGKEFSAPFTTPEPLELQRLLREMADHGVTHVIMEVSSHALDQFRIQGLMFDVALFTNLTRDHLDFHHTMEAYFQAKKRLFTDYLKAEGAAVICVDDDGEVEMAWGRRLLAEVKAARYGAAGPLIACGLGDQGCEVSVGNSFFGSGETVAEIRTGRGCLSIRTNLVGGFNLKNIAGAVGVAEGLQLDLEVVAKSLQAPIRVPGRLESVRVAGGAQLPAVFVDYAHTPDALENVLTTLRQLGPRRLFVVFGCGGDRDPGKRPLMGEIAGKLADVVIITADNSRSESTDGIMAAIEQGVVSAGLTRQGQELVARGYYCAISSRAAAIATAVESAGEGDIVLISGKGHETYQITSDGTQFFDDRLEAARCLEAKSRSMPI